VGHGGSPLDYPAIPHHPTVGRARCGSGGQLLMEGTKGPNTSSPTLSAHPFLARGIKDASSVGTASWVSDRQWAASSFHYQKQARMACGRHATPDAYQHSANAPISQNALPESWEVSIP